MHVLGITIEDWSALLTILAASVGVIWWGIHLAERVLIEPLQRSLKTLTQQINAMDAASQTIHSNHERRLNQHDITLTRHETEINALRKEQI